MDYPREENACLENDAARPVVDAVGTDKMGKTGKIVERSDVFDPVHPPLRVVGARAHNLKNVDVDVPWNRLTALTGPSGSDMSRTTVYKYLSRRLFKTNKKRGVL